MDVREKLLNLELKATGIGSVPHSDTDTVCDLILEKCRLLPYWPQMERVDFRESMMVQYVENFPCIKIDFDNKEVYYDKSADKNGEILTFFENMTSNNYDYFKIGRDFARGFYSILEKSSERENEFIKGQVVGPVTFLLSLIGENGKAIIHDEMISDAVIRGLAMKGVWQAKKIRESGKIPVIFFDEPSLSGFGSAFMALNHEQFFDIFNRLISTFREHDEALIGIHCCGNSDWEMLLQSGIDILNFDAYDYASYLVLYPEGIKKFLEKGGIIAWGAVPTSEYNDDVTIDVIKGRLKEALDVLESKGLSRDYVLGRSIVTPSCGLGTLSADVAGRVTELTCELAGMLNSLL